MIRIRKGVGNGIKSDRVDREISSGQIFIERLDEEDLFWASSVSINSFGPESRDLKSVHDIDAHRNGDSSMLKASEIVLREKGHDLIGGCGCGDVEILRIQVKKHVPHTAAHQIGFKPGILKDLARLGGLRLFDFGQNLRGGLHCGRIIRMSGKSVKMFRKDGGTFKIEPNISAFWENGLS